MEAKAPQRRRRKAQTPDRTDTSVVFAIASAALVGFILGFSLVMAGARGSGALAIGFVTTMASVAFIRPLWGFYLLVPVVLLANESFLDLSGWTTDLGTIVFDNWWKLLSPEGTRRFGFLVVNSVEVMLIAIALGVVLHWSGRGRRPRISTEAIFAILYLATNLVMLAYGLATGGNLKPALWQVRGPMHFVAFALLVPLLLETPSQVRIAIWVLMIPIVFKALQVDWIFLVDLEARFGEWESILGHEDSFLFVNAILLGIVLFLYRVDTGQRELMLVSLPLVTAALVVNLRRASYVALAVCLGLLPLLLHGRRRAVFKWGMPIVVLCGIYGTLYWNRPDTMLGVPLDQLRSLIDSPVDTAEYGSNIYRVAEDINLERTITGHPLGLGYGHPFEIHVPLADISSGFEIWQYQPHNTLLGMWIGAGFFGLLFFLTFCGSIILQACHGLRRVDDTYHKALYFLVITTFVSGLVVANFDHYIGLERGALFLGVVAGISSVLRQLDTLDGPHPGSLDRPVVTEGGPS